MPGGKSESTRSHRRLQLEQQATVPPMKDGTGDNTTDNDDSRTSARTSSNVNDSIHLCIFPVPPLSSGVCQPTILTTWERKQPKK